MSYLVLARKWRPKSFETLVGQDHVVRALSHALTTQRLHHAWLFTGTRGVGKTTLSRILAKSLNCEQGITARPCGQCRACTEIDAGRFVDYVELDAASNRGVDEMTQLLEQAAYAPSAARFKVYMIDEVHMLSGHAFNAMLKTLEEPPPYVKFILATTDPQKIPPTVLSRCLQFNLKQMSADAIVGHLAHVLTEEGVAFEAPALWLIAQAASGSMRDALSLTDQAIAYSAGSLSDDAVRGMLGTIDQRHLVRLLDALLAQDGAAILAVADELAVRGLSYAGALADLAVLLSRLAIVQRVPGAVSDEDPLATDVRRLAQAMQADAIQLFYTVAVHGRGELALAPDEYAGFVMTLLRMLSLAVSVGGASMSASGEVATPSCSAASATGAVSVNPAPEPSAVPLAVEPAVAPAAPESAEVRSASPLAETGDVLVPDTVLRSRLDETVTEVPAMPSSAVIEVAARTSPVPEAALPAPSRTPVAEDEPPWDMDVPMFAPDGEEWLAAGEPDAPATAPPAASRPAKAVRPMQALAQEETVKTSPPRGAIVLDRPWHELAAVLPVTGLAAELARHSEWLGVQGKLVQLRVAARTLAEVSGRERLRQCLTDYFGCPVALEVIVAETGDGTAHAVDAAARAERQRAAEHAIDVDPFVQALTQDFDARVLPGSVRAMTPDADDGR